MSFARGWSCSPIPTAAWNISSASCAGRSTTRSPRNARLTIANWRSRTWKARWPRPRKPRLRRAPQQPRPPPSAVHRDATSGICPGAWNGIEHVIEPDSTQRPCGCGDMVRIGEDRTERLDIVPAQLRVIVTVRPKYACRTCEAGVIQAAAPAHLITGGLPTEGALAQVLVSKYGDHLPLYRQSQIYARSGVELHRSTLAGWVGKASFHLTPVVDRLAWHLKQSGQLFMDETRAPVLDPGRGKTKTGYLWALARDERPWAGPDPPGVVFFYAPGRGGRHAERFLEGFNGILQVDGYAGYNAVAAPGKGVTRAYCWAHARRKLCEIPRQPPLGGRRAGIAPDRGDVRHREADPGRARRGAPGRAPGTHRAAGQGVRGVAEAATRPRLTEVAPGREAGLHRQSLGRGCRCSSPMAAWRWIPMWWKTRSARWL